MYLAKFKYCNFDEIKKFGKNWKKQKYILIKTYFFIVYIYLFIIIYSAKQKTKI